MKDKQNEEKQELRLDLRLLVSLYLLAMGHRFGSELRSLQGDEDRKSGSLSDSGCQGECRGVVQKEPSCSPL